ncbi:hypothetical protein [Pendulispora albinea]|uniref:Glucodextranase-like C-terminal domain-containing protein n=1 Tax=Pendulispora albinea TaxID=2741071 RepID=A0ABZ2LSL8_9BACT
MTRSASHRRGLHRYTLRASVLVGIAVAAGCSFLVDVDTLTGGGGGGGAGDAMGPPKDGDSSDSDRSSDSGSAGPVFVNISTAMPVNAVNFDIDAPVGAQADDLLIAVIYVDKAESKITFPAGWQVQDYFPLCGSAAVWAYRVILPTDERVYHFAATVASSLEALVLVAYRGVHKLAPLDGVAQRTSFGMTRIYTSPGIESRAPNEMLVMLAINDGGENATWVTPDGMIARNNFGIISVFDEMRPTAGPTGPRSAIAPSGTYCGAADLLLLRPPTG